MQLDNRTLVVAAIFVALVLSLIGGLIWRTSPTCPGFGRWTIGNLLVTLCLVLLALRGAVPDWISVLLANTAGIAAGLLFLEGLREFRGLRIFWWPSYGFGALALAAIIYFRYATDNVDARIVAASLCLGMFGVVGGVTLFKEIPARRTFGTVFTGMVFVVAGVAHLFRGIYFSTQPPLPDLFAPSRANTMVFVGCSVAAVAWSFGFFTMTNERMVMDSRATDASGSSRVHNAGQHVLEAEVRQQLQRIVASETFRRSTRMEKFLTLAVERVLSGHPEQLKEYTLGRDVFDRGENYDPRIDSIVRVEAQRLRRKLRDYYETEGAKDAVIVELLSGSYVPLFRYRTPDGNHRARRS